MKPTKTPVGLSPTKALAPKKSGMEPKVTSRFYLPCAITLQDGLEFESLVTMKLKRLQRLEQKLLQPFLNSGQIVRKAMVIVHEYPV